MKQFLKDHHKIVIMGIGNEMRGDDAIGSVLAQEMSKLFLEKERITIIDGKTVPENFTGTIKRETPSHIILLDAVEMNKTPGQIKLVKKDEIENYNISTHAMPLSFLIKYLESTSSAKIILLGIQPKEMDLTNEISSEVQTSANYIVELFHAILK